MQMWCNEMFWEIMKKEKKTEEKQVAKKISHTSHENL